MRETSGRASLSSYCLPVFRGRAPTWLSGGRQQEITGVVEFLLRVPTAWVAYRQITASIGPGEMNDDEGSGANRLDAGLRDDVAPFRHFVVDALAHAVGPVGDDLEAIVAQLLRDRRPLQDFDRLGR